MTGETTDAVAALDADERAELERLRELVGPSELGYTTLLADRERAVEIAKRAKHEVGELKAHVEQLSSDVWRARQDQDLVVRRREMSLSAYVAYRAKRRWRISAAPRIRRLVDRARRGSPAP